MRLPAPRPRRFRLLIASIALILDPIGARAGGPDHRDDAFPGKPVRVVDAVIRDLDGQPVAGAVVVAGDPHLGRPNHQFFLTDAEGRFSWTMPEGAMTAYFVAYKEGRAPLIHSRFMPAEKREDHVDGKLRPPEDFRGRLIDAEGQAVTRARVKVALFGHGREAQRAGPGRLGSYSTGVTYLHPAVLDGSPLQSLYEAITDLDGSFAFRDCPAGSYLKLAVTTVDGVAMTARAESPPKGYVSEEEDHPLLNRRRGIPLDADPVAADLANSGFFAAKPDGSSRFVVVPTARVVGVVTTKLPGVAVSDLKVHLQDSHQPGIPPKHVNINPPAVSTHADGRFTIDGLNPGTINVFVHDEGDGERWTYRAAKDVLLLRGETARVHIELIQGVEVEGLVRRRGDHAPISGAGVGSYGPRWPKSGAATRFAHTDAAGRFRVLLPAGETFFYVGDMPAGYASPDKDQSRVTVMIPEGVDRFEVPPLEIAPSVTAWGLVIDAGGQPVDGARVVGVHDQSGVEVPMLSRDARTNLLGEFRLPPALNNTVAFGNPAFLKVETAEGVTATLKVVPAADGQVKVQLPARP